MNLSEDASGKCDVMLKMCTLTALTGQVYVAF